jgi:carotenoid cleavage dioxygenase
MNNPFLENDFAPVHDELDVQNLKVIGKIPEKLNGVYMRNGPNPYFPPITYTYPIDGDGMIHAVYINDGKASYRNRFVKTEELLQEQKAGRALYGGVKAPYFFDPAQPGEKTLAIKNGAYIHIIRHAGHYLALGEANPGYEITAELETLGKWAPLPNATPLAVSPHSRLDPRTGSRWFVNYDVVPPFLSIYCVDVSGKVTKSVNVEKDYCTMFHDFVLTENYVVFFDCPVVLDIKALEHGGSLFGWQPELGTRIGVMPKKGGPVQWIQAESFFVYHFANAYEANGEIIVDYIRYAEFSLEDNKVIPANLYRTHIKLEEGLATHMALDNRDVEFPRICEALDSFKHRFIYTPTLTATGKNPLSFNAIVKYDVDHSVSSLHDFGDHTEIDEAVFVSAEKSTAEDDGYLILFAYNNRLKQSELVILDAKNIGAEPIARIQIPHRIPHGLHGSWMPA